MAFTPSFATLSEPDDSSFAATLADNSSMAFVAQTSNFSQSGFKMPAPLPGRPGAGGNAAGGTAGLPRFGKGDGAGAPTRMHARATCLRMLCAISYAPMLIHLSCIPGAPSAANWNSRSRKRARASLESHKQTASKRVRLPKSLCSGSGAKRW